MVAASLPSVTNMTRALVDIDKQSDVVLAAPGGGFIDREPGHARSHWWRPRRVDIMMNDTP